jgi:hypothetical protein
MQGIDLTLQYFDKQPHQAVDLVCRPAPVFAAEGEERQHLNACLGRGFNYGPGGSNASPMPGVTGLAVG